MSTEQALLAAVWDRPHDDTPRLVYADWLEETGDPANAARAEFIRVQCELARLDEDDPPRPGEEDLTAWGMGVTECPLASPRRAELLRREERLRKAHAKTWKAGVPAKLRAAPYHRGFLAPKLEVLSSRKFLGLSDADLAPAPLWNVALSYHKSDFPKAVAAPTFLRVGRLEVRSDSRPPAGFIQALADAPTARNVARLSPGMDLGDDGLLALAGSPHLSGLKVIQLAYKGITSPGLGRALAGRTTHWQLAELYLRHNALDDEAVSAIVQSPSCSRLRALSLAENQGVSDAGVAELVRSPVTRGLRYLNLDNVRGLTDRAALAIAESPYCANLRVLFLNRAGFGDKGAAALAESPHLSRMEFLAMFDTKTKKSGPAGQALVKRFGEKVRF